jgi:hypothetical protein
MLVGKTHHRETTKNGITVTSLIELVQYCYTRISCIAVFIIIYPINKYLIALCMKIWYIFIGKCINPIITSI